MNFKSFFTLIILVLLISPFCDAQKKDLNEDTIIHVSLNAFEKNTKMQSMLLSYFKLKDNYYLIDNNYPFSLLDMSFCEYGEYDIDSIVHTINLREENRILKKINKSKWNLVDKNKIAKYDKIVNYLNSKYPNCIFFIKQTFINSVFLKVNCIPINCYLCNSNFDFIFENNSYIIPIKYINIWE
jgi:archaellum biogenesis protein FlaJ (TadC family)